MLFYKVLRFFVRPILAVLFPTKVIGKENFPTGRAVVICNHYSSADSLVLGAKLFKNSVNCVAKKEAFENKLVGKIFEKIGAISIDRDAPGLVAHKRIMNVLKNDDILLIFPEGTRNKEGTSIMAPIKHGAGLYAVKGKADITPMLYHHKHKMFHRNYIIVGKPISLEPYYDRNNSEIKEEITNLITAKLADLRVEIDQYVNNRKKR